MNYIYRMSNASGIGCYQFMDDNDFLQPHNADIENHPCPQFDRGILRHPEKYEICGFKSLTQLKKWFTLKEIKMLRENGFTIKKIHVASISAVGEKQVLAIIENTDVRTTEKQLEMVFDLP
jgi:hypothetical protein